MMEGMAGAPPGGHAAWLGSFGEEWFHTLCVAARVVVVRPELDVEGVDRYLWEAGRGEKTRVQIKTTEHPTAIADGFSFPLSIASYDALRQSHSPAFLVLVVVHRVHPCWTEHYLRGSVVRASALWARLDGRPVRPNRSSVSITLPLANLVTPAVIRGMCAPGGEGDGAGG